MLTDLRAIWSEDHYQILAHVNDTVFCGRIKGESYQVYKRKLSSRARKLVQHVSLDHDWFWHPELCLLTKDVYAGDVAKVLRDESFLAGYSLGEKTTGWLQDLSSQVVVRDFVLESGACGFIVEPCQCRTWLLSLHGGPESFEGTEIRYGGMYRDLLRSGTGVVVLNYVGSKTGDNQMARRAWGRWGESIVSDISAFARSGLIENFTFQNMSVFGVSFGGALALILRKHFRFRQTLLSSPLLDLASQISRADADSKSWFQQRFSARDIEELEFEELTKGEGQVICFGGSRDEVLGAENYLRAARITSQWKVTIQDCGHVPQSYRDVRDRFGTLASASCV